MWNISTCSYGSSSHISTSYTAVLHFLWLLFTNLYSIRIVSASVIEIQRINLKWRSKSETHTIVHVEKCCDARASRTHDRTVTLWNPTPKQTQILSSSTYILTIRIVSSLSRQEWYTCVNATERSRQVTSAHDSELRQTTVLCILFVLHLYFIYYTETVREIWQ